MAFKVLVAEDDPVIGSMLKQILGLEGFEIDTVAEGTRALAALRAGSYDAAVLDVMLPGKDGVSIMREIREAEETKALPVVMLTAKADDASTWAGWTAGCDCYLTKPFDPEQLVSVLKRLLTGG